nr:hypothetical protein [Pseudomonadota bacterium]
MIHLNTSFLIHALVPEIPRPTGNSENGCVVEFRLESVRLSGQSCGPVKAHEIELAARINPEQVSFVAEDAELSARLFNLGGRRRGSMGDCMIAATTMRC